MFFVWNGRDVAAEGFVRGEETRRLVREKRRVGKGNGVKEECIEDECGRMRGLCKRSAWGLEG